MNKICGIYKITSPTNKIYIGQSIDIMRRFRQYRALHIQAQTKLYHSFIKHGVSNHKFEIIHECLRDELGRWEVFYIKQFDTFNTKHGLNLDSGGDSYMHSEETKAKLRKPKSDIAKEHYRIAALKRPPVSKETREKHRKAMLGNKNLLGKKVWLGRHHTKATKSVLSIKSSLHTGTSNPNYRHGRNCKIKPILQ